MQRQFNKDLRKELAILLKAFHTAKECADLLGFTKRSVNREIKENIDSDGVYRGCLAHKKYLARRLQAKEKSRKIDNNILLEKHIIKRLNKRDSPEEICGRINNNLVKNISITITPPTVYRWIYTERPDLIKYLRVIGRKGKYRRRKGTREREKQREEGKVKRIDTRDVIVEKRERIGDWEGDTIVGKEKTIRLLSNLERKSGYGLLDKLALVNMEIVHDKLRERFSKIAKNKKFTYTYDNGTELGKEDRDLEKKIQMEVYRAYPFHSWERGSNENYNKLVRDFFPKGTNFAEITEKDVKKVERNLNHRPRKRLNYLTPHEVFVKNMNPSEVGRFKV
jgi:IS30 family transposase